jgi:hypothetical protein
MWLEWVFSTLAPIAAWTFPRTHYNRAFFQVTG